MRALRRAMSGPRWVAGAGLASIVTCCAVVVWAMNRLPYSTWSLAIYVPAILAVSIPIIVAVTRRDAQDVTGIALAGLVVKVGASFVRYYVAFGVYGGVADASNYDSNGRAIAARYWNGEVSVFGLLPRGRGTAFLQQFTGAVYAFVGPSLLVGFVIFAWLGYWGLFLFHRAMVIGFPEADQRRYAWFCFFLPSMLFWPSSIGKEAFMMLAIGLSSYGVARFLERRRGGLSLAIAGMLLGGMVRPQVSAMIFAGLTLAIVFRRSTRRPLFGPMGRVVLVLVFVVGSAFAFSQVIHYFYPQGDTSLSSATTVLTRASLQTAGGGSATESAVPNSPAKYPAAMFSVLFRPTILEANNKLNFAAGVETTFMLVMLARGWRRLRRIPSVIFKRPYVLFALGYSFLFTFAWSSFSNLGAIARQRVQVWPLLIVVLAIPLTGDVRASDEAVPAVLGLRHQRQPALGGPPAV